MVVINLICRMIYEDFDCDNTVVADIFHYKRTALSSTAGHSSQQINAVCPDMPGVYYQSVGSKAKKATGSKFPLNLSYHLVKHFDGENDGLVSVDSMKWGESFTRLTPKGRRGITHGDVIDLNRENIKDFDVRVFYIVLVNDLKNKGF